MICKEKCIVMDIDGTLCPVKSDDMHYEDLKPYQDIIARLNEYRKMGFYVILYTSRQMRTHEGNIGRINAKTAKTMLTWLDKHNVPYDEIHFGKPWQGRGGFYVDDKTIRPDEFLRLDYDEILRLVGK